MKLTEKSSEVLNFVKDNGGKVTVDAICEATGRAPRSINANVTDLKKKGLADREKVSDGDKETTFVVLTAEGMNFVPTDED